jgi:uncharacterized protein Smg (DUF494 family)
MNREELLESLTNLEKSIKDRDELTLDDYKQHMLMLLFLIKELIKETVKYA